MTPAPSAKLDKIRKLLAMAKSPTANANEADTARQLAESMMAAAGVTEADVAPGEADPAASVRAEDGDPVPAAGWYWTAAQAVARLLGCYTFRGTRRVEGRRVVVRVWVGTDDQRAAAVELYRWVVAQIDSLAEGARKISRGHHSPRAFLNAYRLGVAGGIAARVREMVEYRAREAPPVGDALVLRDRVQVAIKKAVDAQGKFTRRVSSHSSSAAYAAGAAAGSTVRLHREAAGATTKRLGSG